MKAGKLLAGIVTVAVFSGVVELSNNSGAIKISAGQTAYAADNQRPGGIGGPNSGPGGPGGGWVRPGAQGNPGGQGGPGGMRTFGPKTDLTGTVAPGIVKSVSATELVLSITSSAWKSNEGFVPTTVDQTFTVNEQTQLKLNDEVSPVTDLPKNVPVQVQYGRVQTGKEEFHLVAINIRATLQVTGIVASIGENSFVLKVNPMMANGYIVSGTSATEKAPEEWTILVNDKTQKLSYGQGEKEVFVLADLKEGGMANVFYNKREVKDGKTTITASKVANFSGQRGQRGGNRPNPEQGAGDNNRPAPKKEAPQGEEAK